MNRYTWKGLHTNNENDRDLVSHVVCPGRNSRAVASLVDCLLHVTVFVLCNATSTSSLISIHCMKRDMILTISQSRPLRPCMSARQHLYPTRIHILRRSEYTLRSGKRDNSRVSHRVLGDPRQRFSCDKQNGKMIKTYLCPHQRLPMR